MADMMDEDELRDEEAFQELDFGGVSCVRRLSDMYVQGSDLCAALGKKWGNCRNTRGFQRKVKTRSNDLGVTEAALVVTKDGQNGSTWIESELALYLVGRYKPNALAAATAALASEFTSEHKIINIKSCDGKVLLSRVRTSDGFHDSLTICAAATIKMKYSHFKRFMDVRKLMADAKREYGGEVVEHLQGLYSGIWMLPIVAKAYAIKAKVPDMGIIFGEHESDDVADQATEVLEVAGPDEHDATEALVEVEGAEAHDATEEPQVEGPDEHDAAEAPEVEGAEAHDATEEPQVEGPDEHDAVEATDATEALEIEGAEEHDGAEASNTELEEVLAEEDGVVGSIPQGFPTNIEDLATLCKCHKAHLVAVMKATFEENVDYVYHGLPRPPGRRGRVRQHIFLREACGKQLLTMHALRTRKVISVEGMFELEFIKRYMPKEAETLDFIEEALGATFRIKRQHPVCGRRVDMYFPDQRVALECDEHGHAGRDQVDESFRQATIEEELGCVFVRYNPDATDFSLAKLMSTLLQRLIERS